MSRYLFRLQRLLDLRHRKEQDAAGMAATARADADTAVRREHGLMALRDSTRQEMLPLPGQTVRVADLHEVEFLVRVLDVRVEGAKEATLAAEQSVQEKMAALSVAMQHRRILDRLKERRADEWRTDDARRDRDEMDEIARGRHVDGKKPLTSTN